MVGRRLVEGEVRVHAGRGGHGRLVGKVLDEHCLSKRIPLGSEGFFIAPKTGRLYLRCQDEFNSLADNQGRILVELYR